MPPPIAKGKKDAEWGRMKTESTVRAWFSFMAVSMSEMLGIRREWDARFAQLPTRDSGEDATDIPPELHLKWVTLKVRGAKGSGDGPPNLGTYRPDPVHGVTGALENPPVNPLKGVGRTAAQVKQDLRAHQAWMRSKQHQYPPLFQADYALVQPPGHSVQLHRVASGLFIEDATAEELCFQTVQYTQHMSRYGGFWGEFLLSVNEHYNPANPKLGTMYLRHNQMTREHVKVYNVDVVVLPSQPTAPGARPETRIRIHTKSLAELARVCPEYPMPSPLPPTHTADGFVAAATNAADEEAEVGGEDDRDDDPPPPIPDGFSAVVAQTANTPLDHVMLWTAVGRARAAWHVGKVVKTYGSDFLFRGKRVTHDVQLDGKSEVRPVNLSPESFEEGCWLAIEPTPAAGAPVDAPAAAPEAAPAVALVDAPAAAQSLAARPRRSNAQREYECE